MLAITQAICDYRRTHGIDGPLYLETLKTYFSEHHIRIEVVFVVVMIAMGRHIIQVDFEHTPGPQLFGLAALMLSLALGYFLVKKAHANVPPQRSAL